MEYREWVDTRAISQRMYLLAVEGRVPADEDMGNNGVDDAPS